MFVIFFYTLLQKRVIFPKRRKIGIFHLPTRLLLLAHVCVHWTGRCNVAGLLLLLLSARVIVVVGCIVIYRKRNIVTGRGRTARKRRILRRRRETGVHRRLGATSAAATPACTNSVATRQHVGRVQHIRGRGVESQHWNRNGRLDKALAGAATKQLAARVAPDGAARAERT
jgi:hypothetical protein